MKYENKIYAIKELFETPFEIKKRELMLYRTLTGYNLAEEVAATNPNIPSPDSASTALVIFS